MFEAKNTRFRSKPNHISDVEIMGIFILFHFGSLFETFSIFFSIITFFILQMKKIRDSKLNPVFPFTQNISIIPIRKIHNIFHFNSDKIPDNVLKVKLYSHSFIQPTFVFFEP